MTSSVSTPTWTPVLADPEFDVPGWVGVPLDLDENARARWVQEAAETVKALAPDHSDTPAGREVEALLDAALRHRAESESSMIFQIWPSIAGQTAFCHLNMVPSDTLPSWTTTDAVVHSTDAVHLGKGVQCVTTRTLDVPGEDGVVDVVGVHFVFDDGTHAVIVSVEETLTAVVAAALPGVLAFIQTLRVVDPQRSVDFEGVVPSGTSDSEWTVREGSWT